MWVNEVPLWVIQIRMGIDQIPLRVIQFRTRVN
jgi:hypothetical protein